jgi:hypothetical protein
MNAATHAKPSSAPSASPSLTSDHRHVTGHRFEDLCDVGATCVRTALDILLIGCVVFGVWWCLITALG